MYTGTYTVKDTTICPLSVVITQQGNRYVYTYQGTRGRVEVVKDEAETYFTFIGLKGQDPEEDITAAWQDSVLLIQNYGNSMNEYTRFGNCDAKYLELHRQ